MGRLRLKSSEVLPNRRRWQMAFCKAHRGICYAVCDHSTYSFRAQFFTSTSFMRAQSESKLVPESDMLIASTYSLCAFATSSAFTTGAQVSGSAFCSRPNRVTWSRRLRRRGFRMADTTDQLESASSAPTESSAAPSSSSSAVSDRTGEEKQVLLDENITEFCSINPNTGKREELSIRDKENLFLDAMQSYFRGESILTNAEFDALKEELTWQGSDLVSLSRDEFRFLDAARAYDQGRSLMSDEEFDALKLKLSEQGSIVAIQRGPRCSIARKITFSDVIPDKRRTFVLYIPAGLIVALAWLSFSYEFTPLHNVDPVISLFLGTPVIYFLAKAITGLVLPSPYIVVGDCPSCGRRTHVLFGNVLNIRGFTDIADVKCDKCKATLKVERENKRMILIAEGGK